MFCLAVWQNGVRSRCVTEFLWKKKIAPTDVHQRLRNICNSYEYTTQGGGIMWKMCLVFLVSVVASTEIDNILLSMLFFLNFYNEYSIVDVLSIFTCRWWSRNQFLRHAYDELCSGHVLRIWLFPTWKHTHTHI